LIYLIRKTYGWHKKVDRISLSQFSKEIGIDRRLIHRTLKMLSSKGMIVVVPQDDRKIVSYGFQKDYDKWILSSPKMTHRKSVIPQDDALSSPEIPTKETNTKENIYTSDFISFWNSYPKRIGKKATLKAWMKAKDKPLIDYILSKINQQKESDQWKKDNGQYIPNPSTWINQGRWDDEISIPKEKLKWK